MDDWKVLNEKYSAGAQEPRKADEWGALNRRYVQQFAESTAPLPDNSPEMYALQRMVQDMPAGERALAQIGSGFTNSVLAAKQIVGKASEKDADAKRSIDKALNDYAGGGTLEFVGQTAPTLGIPAGSIAQGVRLLGRVGPTAARVANAVAPTVEGMTQGGISGAAIPVGTGDSRAMNVGLGMVGGSIAPSSALALRMSAGRTSPEAARLAQLAIQKYGIPLQASDLTDSRVLKAINSIASDMPVTGGIAAGRQQAKQRAFNRGVAQTFGETADSVTPDVASSAYRRMQDVYDNIYSRNPADVFAVQSSIQPVLSRLAQEGTDEQRRIAQARLQELYSRVDPQGQIDGNFFNRWQSALRETAKGRNDDLLMSLRADALRAYNAGISGNDAALLRTNNANYRNYKTVEPLVNKAGGSDGNISPGQLATQVAKNFSDYGRGGAGDLGELARIGQRFMVDRVPQTGGSGRAMVQNAATVAGAGVGGAVGGIPGALIGAAAPVGAIGLVNGALNNNLVRNGLMASALNGPAAPRMLLQLSRPQPVEMLSEITRRGIQSATAPAVFGGLLSY